MAGSRSRAPAEATPPNPSEAGPRAPDAGQAPTDASLVQVALPLPLHRTFTYRVPSHLAQRVTPGCQVLAPFHGRLLTGFVVGRGANRPEAPLEVAGAAPSYQIKELRDVLEGEALVTEELLKLADWIGHYYVSGLGEVLHAVFPAGVAGRAERRVRLLRPPTGEERERAAARGGAVRGVLETLEEKGDAAAAALARRFGRAPAARAVRALAEWGVAEPWSGVRRGMAARTVRMVRLADRGLAEEARERLARRAPGQARVLEALLEKGELEAARLGRLARATPEAVRRLRELGLVAERHQAWVRRPAELAEEAELPRPTLMPAQAEAAAAVSAAIDECARGEGKEGGAAAGAPPVFLLHGVTASGKTEVYLRAIETALRHDRQVIVLVPEISLAPQTVRQVVARFGQTVAVLHSRLSSGERRDAWEQIRRGQASVVVGARSAVFAPLERLGLIVVDEEHEGSYKQDEQPRYHARAAAIMRARLAGAVALLGSATPSLESYRLAKEGKYRLLALPERVDGGVLPPARIVDLRRETGPRPVILSQLLRERMAERLARGEQVILFLNRRGFSPFVQCLDCGWRARCPHCDLTLTYHAEGRRLRCHYCDHGEGAPQQCAQCRGAQLDFKGVGTQRVEAEVAAHFPGARLARMDFDSTRRHGAHARLYREMLRGEIDILLGTQMVAKGLHFPRVGLVGVIGADVALALPDFRATERTFQILTQVAGRAGRGGAGSEPGEVVIQTYSPAHYGVTAAARHDYEEFSERELVDRKELLYPPFGRLTRILLRGEESAVVEVEAGRLRAVLEEELTRPAAKWQRHGRTWFRMVGPAEAPLSRVRGKYRRHLLIKCERWEPLHDVVGEAMRRFREEAGSGAAGKVELVVDVDPVDML